MKFVISIMFVNELLLSVQADCPSKSTSMQLREALLCGYDKVERPTNSQDKQTQIYVMFIPRYIEFDDSNDFIRLSTLIYMSWSDTNLQWSKQQYGISITPINPDSIWVPDFRILNSKMINGDLNTQGVSVLVVNYDGHVHYAIPSLLGAHCIADWTNWPFDTHVCNFSITSEMHMGSELDLFNNDKIDIKMNKFIHSNEWKLLEYNSFREVAYNSDKNDTEAEYEVFMNLRFIIQRHSSVLAASYISPAIAIVAFSLGMLFIEPKHSDRITISCLLLFLQSLYLQYLAYKIPSNGDTTPKIVRFFVSSLMMTALLLLETFIVGSMPSWTSKPMWLQTVIKTAGANKILQTIVQPENELKNVFDTTESGNDEGLSTVKNDDVRQQWKIFAGIINRLTIFFIFMFYVIFIIMCLIV